MPDTGSRLVTVTGPEEALTRFHTMGAEPIFYGFLVRWWARLFHQIENGNGTRSTSSLNSGSVTIEVAVDELVAAYHDFSPYVHFTIDVAVVFPPLIAAVFSDGDDSRAVMDATRERLQA